MNAYTINGISHAAPEINSVSDDIPAITGGQIRAARAFLRWRAEDLAKAARVGVATVRRAEMEDGVPNMLQNNMSAIRRALENAGIEFTDTGAPGVALKRARSDLLIALGGGDE